MNDVETKLIASALYEIRLLLGSYLGSENEAPADVRIAAHLAYVSRPAWLYTRFLNNSGDFSRQSLSAWIGVLWSSARCGMLWL